MGDRAIYCARLESVWPKDTGGSNPSSAMLVVGSLWIDSAIHAEKQENYPQIANSDTDLPSLERFYFALSPNGAICLRFPQATS
jgi:hypothetical protein